MSYSEVYEEVAKKLKKPCPPLEIPIFSINPGEGLLVHFQRENARRSVLILSDTEVEDGKANTNLAQRRLDLLAQGYTIGWINQNLQWEPIGRSYWWPHDRKGVGFGIAKEDLPNPTPEERADPLFDAIWRAVKTWDVNVPEAYSGYCGANGSHVTVIYRAIVGLRERKAEPLAKEPREKPKAAGDRW